MNWRVQTVTEIVLSELEHNHTLEELAQRVDLSPWHLSHLFKVELGVPLKQYLIQLRLHTAADLLAGSLLTITQVMDQVGIRDRSHFTRDFKQEFGMTPSAYRAHCCQQRATASFATD